MDFWLTVKVIFRRWYITLPAFLAALGVASMVYRSVPTQYVSISVLLLTAPRTGPTAELASEQPKAITNPLLNFEQGLNLSASMLIQALRSPEMSASLGVSPGDGTSYEVSNGSTNPELLESGPFVFIEGTSSSPQDAQDIVRRVSALATQELAEQQEEFKVPESTHITVHEVVSPTSAQAPKAKKLRAAGAAGALGVFASLAAGFAFESITTTRVRRQSNSRSRSPELESDRVNVPLLTSQSP
jgi:uncharacterized protein involved in exopolysaccharide biosynthesis